MTRTLGFLCAGMALICAPVQAHAQGGVQFGDDSGEWARDGECDDPRFQGQGMAEYLYDENAYRDASDCRALFSQRMIRLVVSDAVDFGDDSSEWSFDGECDDPRFIGDGMAASLLAEDRGRDASDCRSLYRAGHIRLR